jgi:hypothetical protein
LIVAIDESNRSTGPGLYVLAAVVVPHPVAGELRASLRALLLPRQQRLHWTKESQQRRLKTLNLVTHPRVELYAYVARAPWRKHESARGQSLALILRNHCKTASEVIIESREAHRDKYDHQVIVHARHRALLSRTVEVNFMAPRDEPLLWAADALAGATLACVARSPKAGAYADILGALPIREVA